MTVAQALRDLAHEVPSLIPQCGPVAGGGGDWRKVDGLVLAAVVGSRSPGECSAILHLWAQLLSERGQRGTAINVHARSIYCGLAAVVAGLDGRDREALLGAAPSDDILTFLIPEEVLAPVVQLTARVGFASDWIAERVGEGDGGRWHSLIAPAAARRIISKRISLLPK